MQTIDLAGIASRLAMQPCMNKHGWGWAATGVEARARPGESWNSAHRKLFSVELAEKYGYGNSDELDLPESDIEKIVAVDDLNRSLGDGAESDVRACSARAAKELGTSVETSPWDLANSLAGNAFRVSLLTRPVTAAADRWRNCMRPVGMPDLPKSPDLMPPDSVLGPGPSVDTPRIGGPALDPEERRVAVADATCRESTGYSMVAYEAEWREQTKALKANADELERYDKQMQKINRRAEKVIADYVPSSK